MELQILLEPHSVSVGGAQFKGKVLTGSCRLRCWPEGAEVFGDPTVIDRIVSATYEDTGAGVDAQLLVWGKQIKKDAQYIIDSYILEQTLLTNAKFTDAVEDIEGLLTG